MDLIAQAVGALLAFLVGVIGNIFAHDICASADAVCAKIVRAAAARLAAFDQASTEQQWLADLEEHQTVTEKYRHAVGCFLAAPKMRRCALAPPTIEAAPGLVWRQRTNYVWEARWQRSQKAANAGYIVKGVKLFSCVGNILTAEDRQTIVDYTRHLQAEQDRWLYDPNYREQLEMESAEREQRIQELLALGYSRTDAVKMVYSLKTR